jgi:hypothetical protein
MRFCSRCGFPLAIVSQLVRNAGVLEGFDPKPKGELSKRQRATRWGIILMIISVVISPLSALMTAMKSDFYVLFIPLFLLFVVGLTRVLHAYLLAPNTPTESASPSAAKTRSLSGSDQAALPAGQTVPVTNWRQPVNTSEMARPLSVTDNTTRLLTDESEVN